MQQKYYIGLLSGTSMDAIDAAIVDFNSNKPRLIAAHSHTIPDDLKERTRRLYTPGDNEINCFGECDIEWGRLFAHAALGILKKAQLSKDDIIAIGSHGQTIRHSPKSLHPFTVQIGDPNTIAALTGITTVADFRRMDIALGGQGAPLAPAFHRYLFQKRQSDTFIVNIGGIANVTYLPIDPQKKVLGFDTGPGNTLMDAWCRLHLGKPFDEHGTWAMQGQCDEKFLRRLLNDEYFSQQPPKSTGPEYFHLDWVRSAIAPQDTQRTLLELTAKTITDAIATLASTSSSDVFLCGGGAHNTTLVNRIQDLLGKNFSVSSTESQGVASDWLEAMLFAWLAKMRIENQAIDLKSITGSTLPALLGGVYQ